MINSVTIISFCAAIVVITVVIVLVFDTFFLDVLRHFFFLDLVRCFLVSEDKGLEGFLRESRDLVHVKSDENKWDENQGRDPNWSIELDRYLEYLEHGTYIAIGRVCAMAKIHSQTENLLGNL